MIVENRSLKNRRVERCLNDLLGAKVIGPGAFDLAEERSTDGFYGVSLPISGGIRLVLDFASEDSGLEGRAGKEPVSAGFVDDRTVFDSWAEAFDWIGERVASVDLARALFNDSSFGEAMNSFKNSDYGDLPDIADMLTKEERTYRNAPDSYTENLEAKIFSEYLGNDPRSILGLVLDIESHADDLYRYEDIENPDVPASDCLYVRDVLRDAAKTREERNGYALRNANRRLLESMEKGDVPKMREALADGADPNVSPSSVIRVLKRNGIPFYDTVRELYAAGAKDVYDGALKECDREMYNKARAEGLLERGDASFRRNLDAARLLVGRVMESGVSPSDKSRELLGVCLENVLRVPPSVSFYDDLKRIDDICWRHLEIEPVGIPERFVERTERLVSALKDLERSVAHDHITERPVPAIENRRKTSVGDVLPFEKERDFEEDLIREEKIRLAMDVFEHAFSSCESPSDMAKSIYRESPCGPEIALRIVAPSGECSILRGSSELRELGSWEDMRRANLLVDAIEVTAIVEGHDAEFSATPINVFEFVADWYDTYLSPYAAKIDENQEETMKHGYDRSFLSPEDMEHLAKGLREELKKAVLFADMEADLFLSEANAEHPHFRG